VNANRIYFNRVSDIEAQYYADGEDAYAMVSRTKYFYSRNIVRKRNNDVLVPDLIFFCRKKSSRREKKLPPTKRKINEEIIGCCLINITNIKTATKMPLLTQKNELRSGGQNLSRIAFDYYNEVISLRLNPLT
jgi:hypothetical protein